MVTKSADRRLAQWMLDVGTPATQVFDILAATAGLVEGARVSRELTPPAEAPRRPVSRLHRLERAS